MMLSGGANASRARAEHEKAAPTSQVIDVPYKKRIMRCPEHKVETRPVLNERGQTIDVCYLCEREKKQEDDSIVIEKLRRRDREQE